MIYIMILMLLPEMHSYSKSQSTIPEPYSSTYIKTLIKNPKRLSIDSILGSPFLTNISKKRLPTVINNYGTVLMPVQTFDGRRIYFSRKHSIDNTGGIQDPDDIWYCNKINDSTWSEPINAGDQLNTKDSDVLFSISADGKTALIVRTGKVGKNVKQILYISESNGRIWDTPRPIEIQDFSNNSGFIYAHLVYDNRTLFLAIEGDNSNGGLDLYVCHREGYSMRWSKPLNLGKDINTSGREGSPFLAYDSKTLYFSSNGHGGFGNQDIFMSKRLDSSWLHWSTPVNLGSAINTSGLDHCFTLTSTGDSAYIVTSDSLEERLGIYSVLIPNDLRQDTLKEDIPVASNGTRTVIYFGDNSSEPMISLETLKDMFSRHINAKITIIGYADQRGQNYYNILLSKRRALSVYNALLDAGFSESQLTIKARGKASPMEFGNDLSEQRIVEIFLEPSTSNSEK